ASLPFRASRDIRLHGTSFDADIGCPAVTAAVHQDVKMISSRKVSQASQAEAPHDRLALSGRERVAKYCQLRRLFAGFDQLFAQFGRFIGRYRIEDVMWRVAPLFGFKP